MALRYEAQGTDFPRAMLFSKVKLVGAGRSRIQVTSNATAEVTVFRWLLSDDCAGNCTEQRDEILPMRGIQT